MPDTATEGATLHMVQLYLDARRLVGLGRMLGLPLRQTDTNYLVHCALGELFQDQAPKPYCVEEPHRTASTLENGDVGRCVRVLGYAPVGREALRKLAQGFASPAVYELCDWERCAAKPMPETFPEGMRLGFELRACPVIRKASAGEGRNQGGEKRTWHKGQELDAFLAHVWALNDPDAEVSREAVYRDWLERQFEQRGGAEALSAGVERFAIERAVRRTQGNGRTAKPIKIPDVTFTGTLTVTDSDAFTALLKSGIGRHKSFGFGMLKVRRAN